MKKKQIVIGLAIVALMLLAWPVYLLCDVRFHGPHVVAFNENCARIVREQGLLGQSPDAVRKALGEPTSVYTYEEDGIFTYNYVPHPIFYFAKFQAHFRDGNLSSVEMYDD
jgi:hypothetical protein